MFNLYLKLGFEHLLDLAAYDHLLFVVALTVVYQVSEWKKLLILVTAFTIGHSITLALAVLDIIQFPATIIEWLIPVTILMTAAYNLWIYFKKNKMPGEEHLLGWQLLAFNIGLEVGQLVIVAVVLFINFIVLNILGFKKQTWIGIVNTVVMILCIWIISGLLE